MPDNADSSGFIVQISLRTNPDDRVVINGVSIGGHAGLSIGFIIAGGLMTA
jgi:phage head maturation protease